MADKDDDLLISISTDLATLRRSLKRMESAIGDSTNVVAKKFDRLGADIDRGMSRSLGKATAALNRVGNVAGAAAGRIAGAFAAGVSLQAASRLADAAKNIENALKVAGLQGAALKDVYDQLFASAQRNAAPIESLVTLYSRLSQTQKELGASQAELLQFSDRIALALRVGGTSASEASGALLQLSQALGGGVVRAEEFNSVLEGAPTIAQAVAAGLTDAGGSVSKLRGLVVDGKVSSEAFFRAFLAGSETLNDKVAGAAKTTSQRFVQLQNVLEDTAGKIDKATGASDAFGNTLEDLATTIQQFGDVVVRASESQLGGFVGWLSEGVNKAAEFRKIMGGIPGIIDKMGRLNQDLFNGRPLGTGLTEDAIQSRIEDAHRGEKAAPKTARLPALDPAKEVRKVTLADYPIEDDGKGKKTKGSADRKDDFERELAAIKERTAALNAAYAAQASLNPLVDDYGFALAKATEKQQLLAAAERDGKPITAYLTATIDARAEAYARATAAAAKLSEQQGKLRDDAEAAANKMTDLFMSPLEAAARGESVGKAFGQALLSALVGETFETRIF